MGRGLSPEGRRLLREAITRNKIPLLSSNNIEDAIAKRSAYYDEKVRGRRYKAFVNVGGGVATLGSSLNKRFLPEGVFRELGLQNFPRKGNLILMLEHGVPVIHLLNMQELADKVGLPAAPDYLPEPGEGPVFVKNSYRLPLAIAFFMLYCAACAMILAPEMRRGIFDRWSGKMDGDSV
jgi:hypothetical protein